MTTRKPAVGAGPLPPTLTERDVVLRRFDLAARAAVLAAGLYAQAAMWVLGHSRLYAVAAVVLIGVSIESARRPLARFVAPRHGWRDFSTRQLLAARVVAGVVVVEVCLVVIGSLHITDVHAMATPIGVLLVTVQAAQAMAVESRRDLKLACVLIMAMLVQVGALTTTASVQLPMVFCLVLVAVALGLLQRGSTIADVDAIALPGHAPLTRAAVFPAAAAAVLGLLVFVLLPNSANLGVQVHVRHFGGQSRASASSASGSTATGSASTSAGQGRPISDAGTTQLDLRARGSLSDAAVLVVAADAPAYWQGSVFDSFDGTTWTTADGSTSPWGVDPGSGSPSTQAAPPGTATASGGTARTDSVRVVGASALDVVLAPGDPITYQGRGTVTADANGTAHLTGAGPANGDTYVVSSVQASSTAAQLRVAAGPDMTDPRFTALPAALPARVKTLAHELAGATTNRYDAVTAVEDYLRTHETYDLASPLPAAGQDAVDDFVFTSHRGFCEQFATAAVVMVRSLGIPARLVIGYARGDTTTQQGLRILRGSDAHAWVEVWYQGVGWIESDPTASSVLSPGHVAASQSAQASASGQASPSAQASSSGQASPSAQASASGQASPDQAPTPSLAAPPRAVPTPAPHPAKLRLPGGRRAWIEGVGAAVVLGVLVRTLLASRLGRRFSWRRRLLPVDAWRPGDGPVLAAYLRLDGVLVGMMRGRAPEETVREVSARLGGVVATAAEVNDTVRCLEQECYGIEQPTRTQTKGAIEVLDRLRKAAGSQLVVAARQSARVR